MSRRGWLTIMWELYSYAIDALWRVDYQLCVCFYLTSFILDKETLVRTNPVDVERWFTKGILLDWTHNIVQIHNNVYVGLTIFHCLEYWMWGIFSKILSVPRNTDIDLNHVMLLWNLRYTFCGLNVGYKEAFSCYIVVLCVLTFQMDVFTIDTHEALAMPMVYGSVIWWYFWITWCLLGQHLLSY